MTDYAFPPSFRATDGDDNPLAGGTLRFFAAGTTTPKAVYSDAARSVSLGTQVNTNSAGVPVSGANTPILIYYGTGNYKYELYDADGALVPGMSFDNIIGYVAPVEESTTATPVFPVVSKTTSYVVTSDDRGKLINANPTGGSFSITLPSAVTVGDNFLIGIRHNGTANAVSVLSTGSQNIRFQGNRTAFSLNGQGETLWLISDGSDWIGSGYVPPFRKDLAPYFIVLDSLASPPSNPDSGARYLISGTPTGVWSTLGFADEDIAEADGNGSWIKHTPDEGWMAFDVDEGISYVFRDGAWENFQIDPGESTLKTLIVQDQKASNTDGGTATTDAWTTAVLNTSVVNTITDASLASNKITLPAGRYRVRARKVFAVTGETRIRLKKDVAGTVMGLSESVHAGNIVSTNSSNATVAVTAALECEFEITESTDFILEYYVNVNQASTGTQGLGIPSNISGVVEVYATVTVEDIAAQQGPTGPQGMVGEGGLDAAYAYQLNTATSGDPGSGKILVNNATPASVTQIAVSQTDANGADLTAVIASWDNSTSTTSKARLRWHKEGDPQNFFEFLITGAGTDVGAYWTFPVTYVSHGGTISNGNDVALLVIQTGDMGDPGTTVPDISGLTELGLSELDPAADKLIVWDDSAGSHKSLPAILRDSVSVLDYIPVSEHAAIRARTSTTDLTTYVQAAVDALNASGGGRLIYPSGRYTHGPIYIPYDNIHIRGMGPGATVVKLKDSPGADQWALFAIGIQSDKATTATSDDISVCDLEVDGNKANQLNGTGVSEGVNIGIGAWRCQRLTIKNVLVHDCDGYGLGLVGTDQLDRSDYIIEDVETHSNNYDGIDIKGGTTNAPMRLNLNRVYSHDNGPGFISGRDAVGLDLRGQYVRATNCHTWDNDDHGIRLRDDHLYDAVLVGCTGIGNGGDGFEINGATAGLAFKLIGCWGNDNTGSGFDVRQGPCSLIDCYADGNDANGVLQQTTASDLTIVGGRYSNNTNDGHNCSVAGATLHVSGGAIFELNNRRGIDFDGARLIVDGTIIRNNDTGANTTAGLFIDGANSLSWFSITNCQIYDDVSGHQDYAIAFANAPGAGVIANNDLNGNAVSAFSGTLPSGTVVRGNKGYTSIVAPATNARTDCSNLRTWYVLDRSGVQVSHTGNTSETTLATISVPAGAMGPNGIIRITAIFGATGSAGTKTARVKFGGTTFSQLAMSSAQSGEKVQVEIHNRNSATSQISHNAGGGQAGGWGLSTSAPTTGSITTTSAQDITLTGQLADGADSITIEAYTVEVLYGA